ncbi:MAG: PQQ-binding-like beta-propeller repeat protein [Ignavibacteriae bacterium]|nr:PQQ-binding-like beta-propeller repeat protein [Ignavibacteriota bacterium]
MEKKIPKPTKNEIACNGPIPGDVSLYEKEFEASQKLSTPGYYKSLNSAEIADGQRSGIFPNASFTGSFTEENQVFAYRSEDIYEDTAYIINREPGEIYIVGGESPPMKGKLPAGPYIAKADAATGKQIWRTYLDNGNISGRWIANANLNIHENGYIIFAWANQLVKVDPDTGRVLKQNSIPTGDTPIIDANFKHVTFAPDGTVILKDQTRPTGCTYQGTMAVVKGKMEGLKQTNSHLVAADPDTLEILDHISLPEPATAPHIVTMFEGKIAIYMGVDSGALRCFWDGKKKKLTLDPSWVIKPLKEGQSACDAPSILGDWIILQTNGIGSDTVASSVVAVSQKDPSKMKVIFPFGDLKKGHWSFAPPKATADPDNNLIYSADMGMKKVACISIDPKSGEMEVKYTVDDITNTFQPLIGPKDKRVLILSNIKQDIKIEPVKIALFTAKYKEQVTWRDANTGKIIAESDFFEPLTINSLIVPGFGGRFYFPTANGFIILQVVPKRK